MKQEKGVKMNEQESKKWLTTLLYAWGSDAPAEVIWGLNEFVDYLNKRHRFNISHLVEEDQEGTNGDAIREIAEALDTLEEGDEPI